MKHPRHQHTPLLTWIDGLITLLFSIAALALYVRTLVPGLIPNDSAEFQALAYTLDHAHTTGYEVYTLLAKIFTWIVPLGDVAYRVNLLSAVCAALTIGLVYLAGRVFSGSRWAGITGALALTVSGTFWSQAVIAEVYTMGSLFTAAVLLLVLVWYETGSANAIRAAGLLGGLSIGVHGTVLLLAPAVLALMLLGNRRRQRPWGAALAGVVLGLLLMVSIFAVVDFNETNASMMKVSYQPSITRWGLQPGDLDSFTQRFAFLVGARQWRSAMFVDPAQVIPGNLRVFSTFYAQDFALPFRLMVLIGLIGVFFRDWRLGLFFIVALLVHGLYTLNYRIGDIFVFFISFYIYACALAAEGLMALLRLLKRWQANASKILTPVLSLVLMAILIVPVFSHRLEALKQGEIRFDFMGLRSNQDLEDWHAAIRYNVKALPQDAIVLAGWYDIYGYVYTAHVEQNRPDLLFMEAYPYANAEGMADSLLDLLTQSLRDGRPVYTLEELGELQRSGMRYHRETIGFAQMFKVELR